MSDDIVALWPGAEKEILLRSSSSSYHMRRYDIVFGQRISNHGGMAHGDNALASCGYLVHSCCLCYRVSEYKPTDKYVYVDQ